MWNGTSVEHFGGTSRYHAYFSLNMNSIIILACFNPFSSNRTMFASQPRPFPSFQRPGIVTHDEKWLANIPSRPGRLARAIPKVPEVYCRYMLLVASLLSTVFLIFQIYTPRDIEAQPHLSFFPLIQVDRRYTCRDTLASQGGDVQESGTRCIQHYVYPDVLGSHTPSG